MLNSFKCAPRLVAFLAHAESATQLMMVTSTLKRCHISRCLHSHSFVDGIGIEYNDVDRGSEDDEVMQDNMDNARASMQHPMQMS